MNVIVGKYCKDMMSDGNQAHSSKFTRNIKLFVAFIVVFSLNSISSYASSSSDAKPIRVLSIDGGGTRGIIPAVILAELEKKSGKNVSEMFDLIVGTSTGGLTALYLTTPNAGGHAKYSANDVVTMFESQSKNIYYRSKAHKMKTGMGYFGPQYSLSKKRAVLRDGFGTEDYSATNRLCNVMLTARDLERDKNVLLKNYEAVNDESVDFKLTDLAEAATATPSHFKPAKIESKAGQESVFIDSSVIVNNPTISAIAEARTLFPDAQKMIVVSIGTGTDIREVNHEEYEGKGYLGWGQSILPIMTRGTSDIVDEQAKMLLSGGDNEYYRIQTNLTKADMKVDQASKNHMNRLKLRAEATIDANVNLFSQLAERLQFNSHSEALEDDDLLLDI